MQWFKHQTDASNDPIISDAEDAFGDTGYIIYFKLLELYGAEFSNLEDGQVLNVSTTFLRRKLRKSWAKVEQVLRFYQTNGKLFFELVDNRVYIRIPKFIAISSNWTQRAITKPTEVPTEVPPARELELELELDKDICRVPYKKIIKTLNDNAGTHFKHTTPETKKHIKARWNQGFTLDDFMAVLENKKEWLTDNKMINYYRPETLFGTKFEGYLNKIKHAQPHQPEIKTIEQIKADRHKPVEIPRGAIIRND